jgi:hypothetical protein
MSFERQFGIHEPIPIIQAVQSQVQAVQLTISQAALRKRVLERTALELFERSFFDHKHLFADWESFAQILQKSISGGFLENLCVYGKRKKTIMFSLELVIDWEKHQILANDVAFTKLDPNKSIAEQVDDAIPQIVSFIKTKASAYEIDSVDPLYTYIPGDTNEIARRREVTGTVPISESELKKIEEFVNDSEGHAVTPGRMKEMTITYRLRT